MSTYVIGDLQGCLASLQKLLTKINFNPTVDKLWFVGDLVNRGPDSLACLKFVKGLGDSAICVLGNHDLSLLSDWRTHQQPSKLLKPIWEDAEVHQIMAWLSSLPLAHYDKKQNILMVHAGVPVEWSLEKTLQSSAELQLVLTSEKSQYYFENMWGDKPAQWNEKLRGIEKLRYITNAFTRMRYCFKNGELEFDHNGPVGEQPTDLVPWFEVNRKNNLPRVVFGHWASLMGETHSTQFIGVDTGCVWGHYLSAYRLSDGKFFRQQAEPNYT